ncbi:hypothetical protein M378DRAFT_360144 [Amanita muscaria Koide BX008]|uniref:Uncharacterized protein n=1 Tax=Amanita muscaria (strain Koide BX008) TaxID=946122 RepID=A0A0C2SUT7_AMAMK|nr:hypothetical protein M378DRAFT_360144 [Amanita muscaria Koide BX008]
MYIPGTQTKAQSVDYKKNSIHCNKVYRMYMCGAEESVKNKEATGDSNSASHVDRYNVFTTGHQQESKIRRATSLYLLHVAEVDNQGKR